MRHQQPALTLCLMSDIHLRNVIRTTRIGVVHAPRLRPRRCSLRPSRARLASQAVLFDADGEVITVRAVKSMGEAALASLVGELTSEQRATA